jgi:sortase A
MQLNEKNYSGLNIVDNEVSILDKNESIFRTINHFLLVLLVLLSGYILFIPFIPEITDFYNKNFDKTKGYKYVSNLARRESGQKGISEESLVKPPEDNYLVIPKIGVNAPIIEGIGPEALNLGVWRRPKTSTPESGGNTVITGHRFMYTSGPKTFYHLDKMSLGDRFIVFWEGKEYDYEVVDIFTVNPNQTDIEDNTSEPTITLYTCTPLWSASLRLVIKAKQINI